MIIENSQTWDASLSLETFRAIWPHGKKAGIRYRTYSISLMQGQELWNQADRMSSLSSPIIRYYAVMQIARAITAASSLDNASWQAEKGHGVTFIAPDRGADILPSLGDMKIREDGTYMAVQCVAQALGSPLLKSPASLLDLIAALQDQRVVRSSQQHPGPLTVMIDSRPEYSSPFLTVSGGVDREWLEEHCNKTVPEADLREILINYPSWKSLRPGLTATVEDGSFYGYPHPLLRIGWPDGVWDLRWNGIADIFDEWTPSHGSWQGSTGIVFPSIGANEKPQHPFVTWFLVLYGFSMLARYYGPQWRALLDKERAIQATTLEVLLTGGVQRVREIAGKVLMDYALKAEAYNSEPRTANT